MPPPRAGAPLAAIRNAADEAVRATSLRSVAAAVGMSPTGLRNFLNGRAPYSATLRKLNAWYLQYELSRKAFSAEVARAALLVLLEAVPEPRLERAAARLVGCLRDVHREGGIAAPGWLDALGGG